MEINTEKRRSNIVFNILCFSEQYSPLAGGTTTYVENICENLARLGHNIFLVTYTDDKTLTPGKWIKKGTYSVYNLGLRNGVKYNTRRSRKYFCRELKKTLPKFVAETRPDVVHVLYGHYIPKIFNFWKSKIPIFWTVHNVPPREYSPIKTTRIKWLDDILSRLYFYGVGKIHGAKFHKYHYDAIIVPSKQTRNLLLRKKVDNTKITVIPNGIDTNLFRPQISENKITRHQQETFPLVLCVAGVVEHKGQLILLETMRRIVQVYPEAHLINIGPIRDQNYFREISTYIKQYSLQNNCTFISDKMDIEKLVYYYNQCDIYVQPSLEEGFCMAILEAACCGKPIVGTQTGAMPEILKNTGYHDNLCPIRDSNCLSDKILSTLKILKQKDNNVTIQYQKNATLYSWQSIAQQITKLYQKKIKEISSSNHH